MSESLTFRRSTWKNMVNSIKYPKYPVITATIGAFGAVYLFRSIKTYFKRKEENQVNHASLFARLSNIILNFGSILGVYATPMLFSHPNMSLMHAVCFATAHVPFYWFIDYFTSPTNAAWHNYKSMVANGYSKTKILIYNIISINMIFLSTYACVRSFGVTSFDTWKHKHWNRNNYIILCGKVVMNLCIADIIFHSGHKWLHFNTKYTDLHLMHHACFTSGPSTVLCFNPIDTFLEYIPIYIPTLIFYAFNKDKIAAICSLSAALSWYHFDHDENLDTHHYRHHSFISCYYTAYVPYKEKSIKKDQVIKRLAKGYGYQRSVFIDDSSYYLKQQRKCTIL